MKTKLSHTPALSPSRTLALTLFLVLCSAPCALSQIPQGFNYQAIAKDGSGIPIAGQTIPVRISIQSDSLGGTVFWVELHSDVTTNSSGLFTLVVGKGVKQSGTAATFSAIDWSVWPKYIQTEIDFGGWKNLGSSKMWSVPYAMVSNTSDTWTTSGADIYRATGNVGIGTTNPTFKFQVTGGESLFAYNGGNGSLRFTTGYGNSFMFKPLDHALQLQTDHTGNPVIAYFYKSGQIGIGNTDPEYIMDISGRIRLRTGIGSAGLWLNNAANSSVRSFIGMYDDDRVGFYGVNSNWGMVMDVNNGNVGIGAIAPGQKLTVSGNIFVDGFISGQGAAGYGDVLYVGNDSKLADINYSNTMGIYGMQDPTQGHIRLGSSGPIISGVGGNVGIGTTTPGDKLHVNGGITGESLVLNSTGQTTLRLIKSDNSVDQRLSEFVSLGSAGNFIGRFVNDAYTLADYWLDVARNTGTYTVKSVSFPNGNVGIGTNSPISKLSVQVPTDAWADEVPLFEVKNKKGVPVFAVYNYGVRVLVDHNTSTKAPKGGFQVSSYDYTKAGGTTPLMIINPDSIRFNIDNSSSKAAKGGFSVGSFADAKGIDQDFMYITPSNGTGGKYNTYMGYETGKNSTGPHNTYIGYNAGKGLAGNGSASNIFIGEGSGLNNSGGYETFPLLLPNGSTVTVYNSWGGENVAIGNYTGVDLAGSAFPVGNKNNGKGNVLVGNYAGFKLKEGSKNVILGYQAGNNIVTGSSNVFIGYNAGSQETGSKKLYIANTNTTSPLIYGDFDLNYVTINNDLYVSGNAYKPGGGSWLSSSDFRLKDIIDPFTEGLSAIMALNPVHYSYKEGNQRNLPTKERYIGFIAQDVKAVLPEAVSTASDGFLNLDMHVINVAMVNAIKEQQLQIVSLNDKIARLEKLVEQLMQQK